MSDVTRYMPLHGVTNAASASASVYVSQPGKVNISREGATPTPLAPADWDSILEERIGIMVESGIPEPIAKAKAHVDTMRVHGARPAAIAPTRRETTTGGVVVAERTTNAAEREFGRRTA